MEFKQTNEKIDWQEIKQPPIPHEKRKAVLIYQPFGLGDAIFAQGIAQYYIRGGYKVYWPVIDEYLKDLERAYPDIIWLPENMYLSPGKYNVETVQYDLLHALFAPLFWSNTFGGVLNEYKNVMRLKYDMYGLDWTTWKDHGQWKRNAFKEMELMELVGVYPGQKFNLVSTEFARDKTAHVPEILNGLSTIHVKKLEGFSLFDWAGVMERATEIHFVSSSNIFLLEMLSLDAERINIYLRKPNETSHQNYDYILRSHNYNLIP